MNAGSIKVDPAPPWQKIKVVLATNNPHKVRELQALLAEHAQVLGLAEAAPGREFVEPVETGKTFEENAIIKALDYARQTGQLCLADDSGLEIDALDLRPGVVSSHYCTGGEPTALSRADRDEANNVRVLGELLGVAPERRTARFVCVMVLAAPPNGTLPAQTLAITRGTFEGRIGLESQVPRGSNGFGYDPLFLAAPSFTRTCAELSTAEKNARSHRGGAASAMAAELTRLATTLAR